MLRALSRSILPFLAALAVLLGALEHEDLILQESAADAHVAAPCAPLHDALSPDDADSGTQGAFRFHLSRLWLSPPAAAAQPLPSSAVKTAPPAPVFQDRRIALSGRVALRL